MSKPKLNGSIDLLAKAIRGVFTESIEEVQETVKQEISAVKQDIGMIKQDIDITNQNMQAQFAQQEKKIAKMISSNKQR